MGSKPILFDPFRITFPNMVSNFSKLFSCTQHCSKLLDLAGLSSYEQRRVEETAIHYT